MMSNVVEQKSAGSRLVGAVLWMTGSLVAFTLVAIGSREATRVLSVEEVMFWRNVFALAVLLAVVPLATGSFAFLRTGQISLHLVRNAIHFCGQLAWLKGLVLIPLAQLFALEFTAPLWVAVLAPLILKERLTGFRIAAALIGFVGALVVIKPGAEPLSPGAIWALASALGFAISLVLVKRLVRRDSASTILFYMVFLQAWPALALAWPRLHVPAQPELIWLVVLSLSSLAAHFSLARAFALADAIVVAPLDFLRLPLIAIVAAMIYAEPLDSMVLVGGGIIVLANMVNMLGERRKALAIRPSAPQ